MAVIISCQHVSMRYDTHLTVRDVSFDVETGDYLCIAGENGAGKSTLMRGILGLMKPTEGHIRFDGIKHTEIGYMPQQTTIQKDFPASVSEVVLSGRLNRRGIFPFYTKKDKSYAHTIMEQWGVAELRKKSYAELSIGQRQRVLLALLTAMVIVIGMRMMGAMLISSLIIFPALTAMRVFKSFKSVVIVSAALSVVCFFIGIFASFAYVSPSGNGLPAGASVVAANLVAFCLFAGCGFSKRSYSPPT